MALSLLLSICHGVPFVSKLDQMRKIQIQPQQGILVDEASFRSLDIDDCKAWLDVSHSRDVRNRCCDGHVPAGTPRVFTTNHSPHQFWPAEYFTEAHKFAIDRRIMLVSITQSVVKPQDWTLRQGTLKTT